jgi:hypothetical protein
MGKILDNPNFDWSPMINIMRRGQGVPAGAPTTGIDGFKTAIQSWDRRNLYRSYGTVWDPNDGDEYKKGQWVDDCDKHYDYRNRIARGFSVRVDFAQNPNWENRIKVLEQAGQYDSNNRPDRGRVAMRIEADLDKLQQRQIKTHVYKTDDDKSLIKFNPKEHGITSGVSKDGVNEEGVQLYEKEVFYYDSRGRKFGWKKPRFIRKEEIEQMHRRGNITDWQYEELMHRYIESMWGKKLPGGDPFHALADTKWRFLSHRFRLGIGPTVAWMAITWSEIDKRRWAEDTVDEWLKLLGAEMKKSIPGGH